MKKLHRFLTLCAYAFVLALGMGLALLAFYDWAWHQVFWKLADLRWVGVLLGPFVFVMGLVWMAGEMQWGRNRFLAFRNEGGAVNISTAAISEYLAKLAPSFPSIVHMHAIVEPVRRKIDLVVDIRIKAGPQLHEICEVLQKRVRESMETGLGIKDVRHVIVRVKEISGEHRS
ncbi:MAG: hypothetical protein ACNA71_08685 [Kiritimatiellia bacterium]